MRLYKFQEDCMNDLLKGFKSNPTQVLSWYTGAGKTNVFVEMCRRLIAKNKNIKIGISSYLTIDMKDQVYDRICEFGLKEFTQKLSPEMPISSTPNIYVFNPQGLYKKDLPFKFDYFIVDECHVAMGEDCKMIRTIIKKMCNKDTRKLIVSATPWDVLAMKDFKDAPIFKRPLDAGFKDGLITDFRFHAEESQVEFKPDDFNRVGDVTTGALKTYRQIMKSSCLGKMEYILKTYGKDLGKKVLVICPPGNFSEIAHSLQEKFGGLCFLQYDTIDSDLHKKITDPQVSLNKFKTDPKVRFLFVVNKCQVGFDFQDLTSVIDLTMTRNIKVLAQRCGRIARKSGNKDKHYFYVYDKSLMKDQLEWLISTMIDFTLGAYDGWTTHTAKYRKTSVISQWSLRAPYSETISEVIKAVRSDGNIVNKRTLAYVTQSGPPTKWTLERAKSEAMDYSSRTDMWHRKPALYKWFRLNAKDEMDKIFPLKIKLNYWNEETVEALCRQYGGTMGRRDFKEGPGSGCMYWIETRKRQDLIEKYFPMKYPLWTKERALEALSTVKTWSDVRHRGRIRSYFQRNGGESRWQKIWMGMKPTNKPFNRSESLKAYQARVRELNADSPKETVETAREKKKRWARISKESRKRSA